jgi:hypothetical protein
MDEDVHLPLGPRLFWIGFAVATIVFWAFVGVEIDRFARGGPALPDRVASATPAIH